MDDIHKTTDMPLVDMQGLTGSALTINNDNFQWTLPYQKLIRYEVDWTRCRFKDYRAICMITRQHHSLELKVSDIYVAQADEGSPLEKQLKKLKKRGVFTEVMYQPEGPLPFTTTVSPGWNINDVINTVGSVNYGIGNSAITTTALNTTL